MNHTLLHKILIIPLVIIAIQTLGQSNSADSTDFQKMHNISVNPINMSWFQQAGLTYEFRIGHIGVGTSVGYIYPNHQTYSNYFIAGPTYKGSLGDFHGFYIIPEFNLYPSKLKDINTGMLYFSLKFIYKYMTIDPSESTAWSHDGDRYIYYWMKDNVNVFGGVSCIGYRQHVMHFFIDFCGGVGFMSVSHDIDLYGIAHYPSTPEFRYDPPHPYESHEKNPTVHFSLKLGYSFF